MYQEQCPCAFSCVCGCRKFLLLGKISVLVCSEPDPNPKAAALAASTFGGRAGWGGGSRERGPFLYK